jgi:AcrR family transcriptional regulator
MITKEPYREVRVTDIVRAAQISKRTFYYHFSDKQDLVAWIYRNDIAKVLLRSFPIDELICDSGLPNDKYTALPFYYNARTREHALHAGESWRLIYFYLKDKQGLYNQVFNAEEQNNLKNYLSAIYRGQIERDLQYYTGDRYLAEGSAAFLTDYFYNACMGWIIGDITGGTTNIFHEGKFFYEGKFNPLRNLTYELLRITVDKYSEPSRKINRMAGRTASGL